MGPVYPFHWDNVKYNLSSWLMGRFILGFNPLTTLSIKVPFIEGGIPVRVEQKSVSILKWAIKNTPIPSHYTSWLIGFPILWVIIIPSKPGSIKSPFSQSINQGIFHGSNGDPSPGMMTGGKSSVHNGHGSGTQIGATFYVRPPATMAFSWWTWLQFYYGLWYL